MLQHSPPWKELLPLYVVIFLGFFGFALTIALFIPMLMDKHFPLLPGNASTSLRASYSGLLLAMYPLGQFFGSPMIGNLSDHFGRKKILMTSLLACTLGFSFIAFSIQFHYLYLLFLVLFLPVFVSPTWQFRNPLLPIVQSMSLIKQN